MSRCGCSLALAVAAVVLASGPTMARSFDCGGAKEPIEKLVCTNPKLIQADERLAAAYEEARTQLSAEGQRLLAESQSSWLQYVRTPCPLDPICVDVANGRVGVPFSSVVVIAIAEVFEDRWATLRNTVKRVGPYRIQAVVNYEAKGLGRRSVDDTGPALTRIIIAYPRIDDPVTPETSRWNALARQRVEALVAREKIVGEQDAAISFNVAYASKDIISMLLHRDIDVHGGRRTAKGIGFAVLIPSGRPLQADDLFDPQRPWKDALAETVYDALSQIPEGDHLRPRSAAEIADAVADTEHWTISSDAFTIFFSPGEVADTPEEVELEWSELQPDFVSPPPFPVPPPEEDRH